MADRQDLEIARDFLNFMVNYYAMTKRHVVETNQYRFHSHGFSTLYALRGFRDQPVTMSRFAEEMGITKQQLTKLVNDLERQNFVRRSHNKDNRRQVYIEITDEGCAHLERMIGEILHEITRSLEDIDPEDRIRLGDCSRVMVEIFRRDAENCRARDSGKSEL